MLNINYTVYIYIHIYRENESVWVDMWVIKHFTLLIAVLRTCKVQSLWYTKDLYVHGRRYPVQHWLWHPDLFGKTESVFIITTQLLLTTQRTAFYICHTLNPLTAACDYIQFFMSNLKKTFKHVKDKRWHQPVNFRNRLTSFCQIWINST